MSKLLKSLLMAVYLLGTAGNLWAQNGRSPAVNCSDNDPKPYKIFPDNGFRDATDKSAYVKVTPNESGERVTLELCHSEENCSLIVENRETYALRAIQDYSKSRKNMSYIESGILGTAATFGLYQASKFVTYATALLPKAINTPKSILGISLVGVAAAAGTTALIKKANKEKRMELVLDKITSASHNQCYEDTTVNMKKTGLFDVAARIKTYSIIRPSQKDKEYKLVYDSFKRIHNSRRNSPKSNIGPGYLSPSGRDTNSER